MKIGFVFDDSLDNPDGVQQYLFTLAKYYEEHGHEVHFLVGHTVKAVHKNIHSLSKTLRLRFNGNVVGTPLPVSKNKIKELLVTLDIDVLHVQLPYSPVLAGRVIAAAPRSTAVMGTLHIFPNTAIEHGLNKLLAAINSKTLARFDDIVAVSAVAAKASHIKSRQIAVVPNPVDLSRFQVDTAVIKTNKIVFLGRLVERKGCVEFIKALALLKKQNRLPTDWVIEIGGTGSFKKRIEEVILKAGLQNQVKLSGFIDEKHKPEFLSSAQIAVFPSKGGESFGIVLLEAMAAGTAVIAGDNVGYACVLSGELKNQLVDPRNITLFADKLYELIENSELRNKIVFRQTAHVAQYDIKVVAEEILNRYRNALSLRPKVG